MKVCLNDRVVVEWVGGCLSTWGIDVEVNESKSGKQVTMEWRLIKTACH